MDDKKDIDAWADALLDQHRSAPPRSSDPASIDDLPPVMRFMLRAGGGPLPDAETLERIRTASQRQKRLGNIEAVVTMVGALLLAAFLLLAYSQF